MVTVTGSGPQSKVITPPRATAETTAADVQLAGVPLPMTWSGLLVSTARASAGTAAPPSGFPAGGRANGTALPAATSHPRRRRPAAESAGWSVADASARWAAGGSAATGGSRGPVAEDVVGGAGSPAVQPATVRQAATPIAAAGRRRARTAQMVAVMIDGVRKGNPFAPGVRVSPLEESSGIQVLCSHVASTGLRS
jgi:hypothetical protein